MSYAPWPPRPRRDDHGVMRWPPIRSRVKSPDDETQEFALDGYEIISENGQVWNMPATWFAQPTVPRVLTGAVDSRARVPRWADQQQPSRRCPECGALVFGRCVACEVRRTPREVPFDAIDGDDLYDSYAPNPTELAWRCWVIREFGFRRHSVDGGPSPAEIACRNWVLRDFGIMSPPLRDDQWRHAWGSWEYLAAARGPAEYVFPVVPGP